MDVLKEVRIVRTGQFRGDFIHQGVVSILFGLLAFEEKLDLNIAR